MTKPVTTKKLYAVINGRTKKLLLAWDRTPAIYGSRKMAFEEAQGWQVVEIQIKVRKHVKR